MDPLEQNRICVTLRILVDVERDWMQRSLRVTGVDERHLLADVVHHPESLRDLAPSMARTLLELVDEIRTSTGTAPPGR